VDLSKLPASSWANSGNRTIRKEIVVTNYVPLYTQSAERNPAANTARLIKTYLKMLCFSNKFIGQKMFCQSLLYNENNATFILWESEMQLFF
jgi:hypothetical protein